MLIVLCLLFIKHHICVSNVMRWSRPVLLYNFYIVLHLIPYANLGMQISVECAKEHRSRGQYNQKARGEIEKGCTEKEIWKWHNTEHSK